MTAIATATPYRGTGTVRHRTHEVPRSARRLGVVVWILAVLVASVGLVQAPSAATTAPSAAAATAVSPPARFVREVVRPGDSDTDPYNIEHVRELQYRLKWVGLFHATPTGWYGPITKRAVIAFKKRNHLRPDGVMRAAAWRILIRRTVRGRGAVPGACEKAGWHACYDRSRHHVNLYHRGRLIDSWLVRGGSYYTPTRTGSFTVYYRDIDHVSSRFDDAPMPYSQFFSGGQALHGSRLMMDPFVGHSHGCVNFWTEDARRLWRLTSDKRLRVHVYGAWD